MLDRHIHPKVKPLLSWLAKGLSAASVMADKVTLLGFAIGLCALPLLAWEHYTTALVCILLNRILDGLDGALARETKLTDAGGYLDIVLDFLFYALVPLGFVLANPESNAIAGAFLLFAFIGTGSSFLAFAALSDKYRLDNPDYPHKSFYYIGGLTEGFETILCFILCCLWPSQFPLIAWIFGGLCCLTTLTRIWGGYNTLKQAEKKRTGAGER